MENHAGYFEARADNAVKEGLLDRGTVDFYRALFAYLGSAYGRLSSLPGLPAVRAEDIPLSEHPAAILTEDALNAIAAGVPPLAALMAGHYPGLTLDPLFGPLSKDAGALRDSGAAFIAADQERMTALALGHKTGIEEYIFVMTNLFRPLTTLLRERSAEVIPAGGSPLLCPFCGHLPDMSIIGGGEEGRRSLHCSLCGHRWQFKRLACAVCGTEDASKLEYLSAEGDSRHRIDVCHECGGYIKTVRLEKLEDPGECDPVAENVLTAGLDSAAMREGYRRP